MISQTQDGILIVQRSADPNIVDTAGCYVMRGKIACFLNRIGASPCRDGTPDRNLDSLPEPHLSHTSDAIQSPQDTHTQGSEDGPYIIQGSIITVLLWKDKKPYVDLSIFVLTAIRCLFE